MSDLATDRQALLAAVDAAQQDQIPCRCGGPEFSAAWTSSDPGTQQAAARLCAPCAVLNQCRAFGRSHPKESGVYGGVTEQARRAR